VSDELRKIRALLQVVVILLLGIFILLALISYAVTPPR
jgi:hypothetical protein